MGFRRSFVRDEPYDAATLARAFRHTLGGEGDAKIVLEHLAKVCHAHMPLFVAGDSHGTARLVGRREVWGVIEDLMTMNDEQLRAHSGAVQKEEGE